MSPARAKELLRECWGEQKVLTPAQAEEIAAVQLDHETALDCCQRVAGDAWDWREHGAFHQANVGHFRSL